MHEELSIKAWSAAALSLTEPGASREPRAAARLAERAVNIPVADSAVSQRSLCSIDSHIFNFDPRPQIQKHPPW